MNRTITTAAELDALPVGSVIVEGDHTTPDEGSFLGITTIPGVFHRFPDGWYVVAGYGAREVPLPARVLHDPSAPAPAPSVVPEAAVEAAASAVRQERAFEAAAAFGVPVDAVPQCAEMIAYAALTAALPHLAAVPSAEHIARTLAETTALTGADARLVVQAAVALSGPSATCEDEDEAAILAHVAAVTLPDREAYLAALRCAALVVQAGLTEDALVEALRDLAVGRPRSATREDVEDTLVMTRLSDYAGSDMAVIGQTAEALLARFTITPRTDR